ncbi:ABC transporter substrate-binding protein [Agromyces aerolatus]|uniref:ABC transporter substrate-binding protein n=1 Tax=Agromyces sp. LY-1074 TaxID=3074080 RepID=UPI002855707C|nr:MULTISPECIES: extracellular solute-binding protein [unclassified Agromyces]MDR5699074.1 extracellular solute-binding protein [Agromyces sp. LY-1074]MDR5705148.1 extracellular solute-binding protein [Agromyces sp. LY-1358]
MHRTTSSLTVSRRGFLFGGLGLGALGALALTGCTPGGGGGSAAGTSSTTLTSWVFGQNAGEALRETIADFSAATEITVNENTYPYLQYLNQIVLKARSGNIAGVAHIDEEWLSTLASAGVLKDLGGIVDESLYPSRVMAGGRYDRTRYAMPWTQSAIGMVGNQELLTAAGVDASSIRTVDQFTEALRAITRLDGSLIPYVPCTAVEQLKDMVPWMWVFGGTIVEDGKVTLGDPGSIAAIEYWKLLLDDGLIQAGIVRDDARTLFAQRRAAIYDDAPQAYGVIPPQSDDSDIAGKMLPMSRPSAPGGTGSNLVWSQPLVAFDETDATVSLLSSLSTDLDGLERMFIASGQPPATDEALAADWFTANVFNTSWNETVAAASEVNPLWSFPSATAAQTLFNEAVEAALKGTVTPKQALSEAKDGLTGLLER